MLRGYVRHIKGNVQFEKDLLELTLFFNDNIFNYSSNTIVSNSII